MPAKPKDLLNVMGCEVREPIGRNMALGGKGSELLKFPMDILRVTTGAPQE